jgi:hypothetical protein
MAIWDTIGKAVKGVWNDYLDPKDSFKAQNTALDPNAYQWGGAAGVADAERDRYIALGNGAAGREAPSVYSSGFEADRGLEMQARGNQQNALDQYAGLMNGTGPSLAAIQAQQAQQAAMAQQASMAASARGGGANLAAAQRAAALGGANASGQIANAATMARAQEQLGAIAGYGGLSGQMRQGDASRAGLSGQMGQAQAGTYLSAQQQNDAQQRALEEMAFNTRKAQAEMQMGFQQQRSTNEQAANEINSGVSRGNTATRKQMLGTIASGFADAQSKSAGGTGQAGKAAPGY